MEEELFKNQNYQKKRIKDSLKESNIQLKKIADHLEESCHSEVLISQNQMIYQESNISQNTNNYQSQENEMAQKIPKLKIRYQNQGINQQGLSPIIQTQSLFTNEKELTSLFNQSYQDRNQDFNDEQVKKSINYLKILKELKEKPVMSNLYNLKKKDGKANNSIRKSILNKNVFIYTNIYQKLKQFFQNKTLSGRTQLLKNKQIQFFINDLSDANSETPQSKSYTICIYQQSFFLKKKKDQLKNFSEKQPLKSPILYIPTFNPQNQIIQSIKIIIFLLNSLFYTYLSLALIFGAMMHNIFFLVYFGFWGLEIIIKLNSSIYIKNEHIQNRQTIFNLYFQNEALYYIIPYFLLGITKDFPKNLKISLQLVSFIKARNIIREFNIIQKQICMNTQKQNNIMQLKHLIFKLFILAHTLSCIWYLIGIIEKNFLDQDTWFDEGFSKQENWWKIYVQSLYWSLTLMTTGYFVSSIGLILAQNDEEQMNHRKDINIINQYLRKRKQEQNQTVKDKLSINLREQLLNKYFGSILNKINCLKFNFSQETLNKVSLQMSEAYYLPNQVFVYEENYESNQLYYILEGEVELSRKIQEGSNTRQIISTLKQNYEFGHDSFFTGKANGFQAKAKTFTTAIKVSRESFQTIVKENDKDWQNFNYLKDSILNYNDQKHLKISCQVCQKIQHLTSDCPLLHFNTNDYLDKITYFEKQIEKFQLLFEQQNLISADDKNYIKTQLTSQSDNNELKYRSLNDFSKKELQNQHDLFNKEDKNLGITSQFLNVSDSSSINNIGPDTQQKSITSYPKVFRSYQDFESENNRQKSGLIEDQIRNSNFSKTEKYSKITFNNRIALKNVPNLKKQTKTFSQYSKAVKSLLEQELGPAREKEFKASLFSNQESIKDRTPTKSISKYNNIQFSLMVQNSHDSQYKNSQKQDGFEKQLSEIRQYPFCIEIVKQKNFNQEKLNNREQIKTQKSFDELQKYQQIFENPWLFERQKDFNYYFPEGNKKFVIKKHNRFLKRKIKLSPLKMRSTYKKSI
ncbi:hypothetical protein ABPG72_022156 [Tetrahymena utriculariae]